MDQWQEVKTALTACSNNSFILQVDCKVFINIGTDLYKTIYIESGTNVEFTNDGLFIVNNMFVPAFSIINSVNVTFTGWNLKYAGYFVATPNYGFYYQNGTFTNYISTQIMTQAYKANDYALKSYMTLMRGVKFVSANPTWIGPSNTGALFNIRGSSQYLNFTNFHIFANKESHGNDFFPFAFSFTSGLRSNQTVTSFIAGNITFENHAVPSDLNFYNFTFDGVVMAFQGNLQRANFKRIRSYRYGEIQDLAWDFSGGIGKWFPPPHLFYLNYNDEGDSRLFNYNLTVSDVVDYGQRVGLARDKNFGDTVSGDARSLKIGGHNVIVDNYVSYRADGFLDLLSSNNLVLRNSRGTVDTAFLNYELVPVRFPGKYYRNILIDGLEMTDLAKSTSLKLMGTFPYSIVSYNCILRNVKYIMNIYTGTVSSLTTWGNGNNMNIQYSYSYINPTNSNRVIVQVSYP